MTTPERPDSTLHRQKVIADIILEREAQISQGYTIAHDNLLGLNHLISEVYHRLGHPEFTDEKSMRHELLKATTILVAALEFIERYLEAPVALRIDESPVPLLPHSGSLPSNPGEPYFDDADHA